MNANYWQTKSWHAFSPEEWEALCDGCARCCLVKLEDEQTGEIHYTNIACQLLNLSDCRCRDYKHRQHRVPTCMVISPDRPDILNLLPDTCAYRYLFEQQPLPGWHPLVSGSRQSVHDAGISVKGKVVSEKYIHPEQYEDHIIDWINT